MLKRPEEEEERAVSPTPSALLEEGILKTIDVPGEGTEDIWQEDALAIFHFALYTLRPGTKRLPIPTPEEEDEVEALRKRMETFSTEPIPEKPPQEERVVIRELIRDTRQTLHGRPFELRIGRGFTAPALETAVRSMQIGEQARFFIRPECTEGFVALERALSLQDAHHSSRRGSLSTTSRRNSMVHGCLHQHARRRSLDPLDASITNDLETLPLELHIHMLAYRPPITDEPWWCWSAAKRQEQAIALRQEGNQFYKEGDWLGATARYEMALSLLEPMPDDDRLDKALEESMEDIRHVCQLNLAACTLKLRRYKECIEYCDAVLSRRPGNAKAHYRRASARIALGEALDKAREDLEAARSLMMAELRRRGRRMSEAAITTSTWMNGQGMLEEEGEDLAAVAAASQVARTMAGQGEIYSIYHNHSTTSFTTHDDDDDDDDEAIDSVEK
jgi:tetratricopeptide (TPR) repeat protein